jgi:GT2 family glycosyltransferase
MVHTSSVSSVPRADGRVLALILTHDDPVELQRCVDAVAAQTRRPDAVVVTDNASSPPAAPQVHDAGPGWLTVDHLATNGGPAGGHHAGLSGFVADDRFDLAWVLDDDVVPEPGCLEALVAAAAEGPVGIRWPVQRHTNATDGQYPGWFGVLIPRAVVQRVGTPNPELFWWTEDTEYLQWRIPRAGFSSTVVPGAVVEHTGRRAGARPDWKLYYEARNTIVYRVRTQRLEHPLKLVRILTALSVRAVLDGPGRRRRLRLLGAAVADGARGRLGRRVGLP